MILEEKFLESFEILQELITYTITATRVRQPDEITPVRAEHSATYNNDEAYFGAERAIDLYLGTSSSTVAGSDGTIWLKVTLDKVYCIEQVIWYRNDGTPFLTWACTDTDCSKCVGSDYCSQFTLTVSTEKDVSDLSPVSDCKYGDTVKLERVIGTGIGVKEIAITGKSGNLNYNSQMYKLFFKERLGLK